MSTLEVVHLRFSRLAPAGLAERILASIREERRRAASITLYRRIGLDTDLAIHVLHADEVDPDSSVLARRLATELRTHGLVEHAVWTSIDA